MASGGASFSIGLGTASRVGDLTVGMGGAGGFTDGCFLGASGGFWLCAAGTAGGLGGAVFGLGGSGGGALGGVGALRRPFRSTGVGGLDDPRDAMEHTDSCDLDGGGGLSSCALYSTALPPA